MNKKIIIIGLVVIILSILSFSLEARVILKHNLGLTISTDEVKRSNWYKKYQYININDSYDSVKKIIGKEGKEHPWGLGRVWKFPYGNIGVCILNDKIVYKRINIPSIELVDLDLKLRKEINGYTSKEEVFRKFGKTIEVGKGYDIKSKKEYDQYEWNGKSGKKLKIDFAEGTVYDIDIIGKSPFSY